MARSPLSFGDLAVLVALLPVASCDVTNRNGGTDVTGPGIGTLVVTATVLSGSSTNLSLAINGHVIAQLDKGAPTAIVLNPGVYFVRLIESSGRCVADGTNPRQAKIEANETLEINFALLCPAVSGDPCEGCWDYLTTRGQHPPKTVLFHGRVNLPGQFD